MIFIKKSFCIKLVLSTTIFVLWSTLLQLSASAKESVEVTEERIAKRTGRFYCPSNGHVVVLDVGKKSRIICRIGNKKYNALNGERIYSADDEVPKSSGSAEKFSRSSALSKEALQDGRNDSKNISSHKSADSEEVRRKAVIINNYYGSEGDDNKVLPVMHVDKDQKVSVEKNVPSTRFKRRKNPFSGFAVAIGGQVNGLVATQVYSLSDVSTVRSVNTTNQAPFGTGVVGISYDYQVGKFVMGAYAEFPVIGAAQTLSQPTFTNTANNGIMPGIYVSSAQDYLNFFLRVGIAPYNGAMIYIAGGFGVTGFTQNITNAQNAGLTNLPSSKITTIEPAIAAGFEMIIPGTRGHAFVRAEYVFEYYFGESFSATNTAPPFSLSNPQILTFNFNGFNNIGRITIGYRF